MEQALRREIREEPGVLTGFGSE
ncbi:hypothetical protein ABKV88_21125 [Enterobacter mori]